MDMSRRDFVGGTLLGMGALAAFSGVEALATPSSGEASKTEAGQKGKSYRRIATEEAFSIPEQLEALRGYCSSNWDNLDFVWMKGFLTNPKMPTYNNLIDVDGKRLRIMDEDGVAMHVLSLSSPGVQMFDTDTATAIATLANDRLAEAIKRHPGRYAGLAAFAPQDPKRAVKEMERAITTLKLNGFILNSHTHNEYMDDRKFWPILEAAEALDRPIYLHPRSPSEPMAKPYAQYGMAAAMWGFQAETGLHALRLMLSGAFDQFPKLKIVLGHMGESVPYNLWRTDYWYTIQRPMHGIPAKMKPSEIFKRNFVITTSGVEHQPVLKYCMEVLGVDNIMFAIDYPFQPSRPAVTYMNGVDISEEDKEKIFHRNAERVFHLSP
jgi:5-carboxyvanillate decarboxylase